MSRRRVGYRRSFGPCPVDLKAISTVLAKAPDPRHHLRPSRPHPPPPNREFDNDRRATGANRDPRNAPSRRDGISEPKACRRSDKAALAAAGSVRQHPFSSHGSCLWVRPRAVATTGNRRDSRCPGASTPSQRAAIRRHWNRFRRSPGQRLPLGPEWHSSPPCRAIHPT